MQRHITLGLLISLATAFVIGHIYFNLQLIESITPDVSVAKPTLKKPDFKAIPAGRERKAAFFAYLTPFIEAENQKIASLRSKIAKGNMKPTELEQLAKRYRIKTTDTKAIEQQLLKKVDVIPPSLVLTQAAIESAWGTSRFAVKGCSSPRVFMTSEKKTDRLAMCFFPFALVHDEGSSMPGCSSLMSKSSEKRSMRPKPLESDVPPLNHI